jgi:branched-chain amino acid transport system permease protein
MRLVNIAHGDLIVAAAYLPLAIVHATGIHPLLSLVLVVPLAMLLELGSLALVYGLLRSRIGLALTAIRDSEAASSSLGIDIARIKFAIYVVVASVTAMAGSLIALQKIRVSPDAAFSVNDWTAFVIFIVVMLVAPKGIWGFISQRWNLSLFPTAYVVKEVEP